MGTTNALVSIRQLRGFSTPNANFPCNPVLLDAHQLQIMFPATLISLTQVITVNKILNYNFHIFVPLNCLWNCFVHNNVHLCHFNCCWLVNRIVFYCIVVPSVLVLLFAFFCNVLVFNLYFNIRLLSQHLKNKNRVETPRFSPCGFRIDCKAFISFIPCTANNQLTTPKPTKCTILFLRYLYYNITLNTPTYRAYTKEWCGIKSEYLLKPHHSFLYALYSISIPKGPSSGNQIKATPHKNKLATFAYSSKT